MSIFNVIVAAFFVAIFSAFYFVIDLFSPFPKWLTYILFALVGTVLHSLLLKAKSKWDWMNKQIDGQIVVLLIFLILFSPVLINLILFGFGK